MSIRLRGLAALLSLSLPALAASIPGIDNFDKVDQSVYRGAQPSESGFRSLSQLGVKIVLDLREHDSRSAREERMVTAANMRYVNVPMTGYAAPTLAEMATILKLLEDPAAGPVFVHCKRGADRTGAVIAAYLIDHARWDNARALRDAMAHHMSILQAKRQDFIRHFQAGVVPAVGIAAKDAVGANPASLAADLAVSATTAGKN